MNDLTASSNAQGDYKYWAFISYSHRDKASGEWLHKSVESYRIAKPLRGRNVRMGSIPARLFPVFRDREELAAAPDLGDRIETALRQSRYLIVVCSPASAASPWVNKEIAFFKSLGRDDRIFSLIVDGEPYASEQPGREQEECFPTALRFRVGSDGQVSNARAEPLAADARTDKDGKQNALLKLIAGMLDVGFDDLRQRDLEERNSRLRKIVAASVTLVLTFAALAIYAFNQQRLAEERSRVALSRQLAVQSGTLRESSPDLPLLLSLEALYAEDTVEARRSLFDALMATRRPITLLGSPVKTMLNDMAVSSDGTTLVTAGREGQLVFWDLTNDPPTTRIVHSGSGVNALSVSDDGKLELLAAGQADGSIALWDLATRQRAVDHKIPKQPSAVTALTFGPDNVLAFGYSSEESFGAIKIQLWDLAANSAIATLESTADGSVSSLEFSPDGKMLASSAVGGDTTLWNLSTRESIHSEFLKDTASVAFSPDGKWLASGSWQLTLRDIATFEPFTFELPDAPAHIGAVRFSPDGKFLASVSSNGNAIAWDLETREPLEEPFQLKIGSLNAMTLSPNGRTLYAGSADGQVAIVALDTKPLRKVLRTGGYAGDLAFNAASGELGSIDDGASVAFWDVSALKQVRKTPPSKSKGGGVFAISPNGGTLAVGDNKGQLSFWDAKTMQSQSKAVPVTKDRIDRLAFAPDGLTVAVVGLGREVVLWDVRQHQPYGKPLIADSEHVRDALFSRDGSRVYTVGDDGEVLQWNWRTGERIGSPLKGSSGADALALNADGTLLGVGDYDNKVTLWNVEQEEVAGVPLVAHTNFVRAVAFSPDGQFVASGGDDGTVILWDAKSHQPIAEFRHGASVFSGDGTARTPLAVNRVSFSPDGKVLAADGPEEDILLWDIDLTSWQRQACQRVNRNLTTEEWRRYIGETQYLETCPSGRPRLLRAR